MAELEEVKLEESAYRFSLNNVINYGAESVLTLGRSKDTVFKLFHPDYLLDPRIGERKEKKIKLLAQAESVGEISFFPKIVAALTYDDDFVGYEMTFSDEDNSLDLMKDYLSRDEMIKVLRDLKKEIICLNSHPLKIVYGDLGDTNVLVNQNDFTVSLCDVDNVSILGMGFEVMRPIQEEYLKKHKGKITPRLDMYMHNVLTRDLIFGETSSDPLVKKYVYNEHKGFLIDEL